MSGGKTINLGVNCLPSVSSWWWRWLFANSHLPKLMATNTIDKPCNCLSRIDMWTIRPPKDTWRPWVGWGGSHPTEALHVGICGPHFHYTLTPPLLRWVLGYWTNNYHLETEASWRAHIAGLCTRIIVVVPHQLTYVICTYILHSLRDTIIHCGHINLLTIMG